MANVSREQFISDALASCVDECIRWPFAVRKSSGYGAHSRRSGGHKTNYDVHRFVCELAHGRPEAGQQAAHRCGQKLCINPAHLYWANHRENMDDAKRHGTLRGGGRYRQRFFDEEIADICQSGESLSTLAAQYGSDVSYISRLRRTYRVGIANG